MSSSDDFEAHRVAAAREFAQTMIVVDDDAWRSSPLGATPKAGLRAPRRGRPLPTSDARQEELFRIRHALDTESLVSAALNLGLICSVIRPPKGKSIKRQVSLAAKRADIVCLDWELHEDAGNSATRIIAEIVRSDEERNGRLRLIAIYTGDTNNNQILEKIFEALPKSYRERFGLNRTAVRIEGNHGLRIVCLFKAHGIPLADARKERQIREADLPARLQVEFAHLAGGLLSNVALATIASIRDATHHVLAKMAAPMDGPYFHHRSILPMAGDAEEYSVDVVLSDLKSEVDKRGVAQRYAGPESIAARMREIAAGQTTLPFRYQAGSAATVFDVQLDDAISLVRDGCNTGHAKILTANKPSLKAFRRNLSSLFAKDIATAHDEMREFAVLTGIRSHPGSYLYKSGKKFPQLGLGSVVRNKKGNYYLCLQAACDSVRVKQAAAFLFVPLRQSDEAPEHVVPILGKSSKLEWIGLAAPGTAYAESLSVRFNPDSTTETVLAKKPKRGRLYFFKAANGERYRWIADLKQRRALRTAQKLGQSIGRLGFDEFEPFRQSND